MCAEKSHGAGSAPVQVCVYVFICEPLAKLFVLRIPLSGTTSFIAYLLVNLYEFTCSVGSSRHGVAEGEDGRTEIR
jgi:hypothetical protein